MRVLVLTNQWPRPDLPHCGVMVVRQVDSLADVGVTTQVEALGGSLASYVRGAAKVLRLNFRRREFDLIHGHTGHSGFLACLQVRYPVVFSYVGYDLDVPAEDREGPRTRLERLVFRYLSALVAGTIVKSPRGRARIPQPGRKRSALLPNGVDRSLFRPMDRTEARRQLGWAADGAPIVLFAGDPTRFTKRFELAQAAFDAARARNPDLQLAVCDGVEPVDVPLWMNAADVLLLTSVAEGSPNVVKEAMACNLPVVSVDVGDVREVVVGTRHCHVCPADPAALADAVLEVVAALPERSDGRGRTAHLDQGRIAEELRGVYERALTRGPGPFGFLPRRTRSRAHSLQRLGS